MVSKKHVVNKQLMQKMNRIKVLDIIRKKEVSRVSISEETGLSLATVTNIVSFLINEKLVTETSAESADRVGRRAMLLDFNPVFCSFICVKVDSDKITIALTNLDGFIKAETVESIKGLNPTEVVGFLKKALNDFLEKHNTERVLAVGIGVSALVLNNEKLLFSTSLKWSGFELKREIEEITQRPVIIENITATNGLVAYNKLKSGQDSNVIYIEMENGIGATHIYNGDLNSAVIGEIGHTTVEPNGERCFCGNTGCLEVMCSGDRIAALAAKARPGTAVGSAITLGQIITELGTNEKIGEIVDKCCEYLGIAVSNIVNIFNPQKIIINDIQYGDTDYIYNYIIECVKRRVNNALLENLSFENYRISEEEKIAGIARHLTNIIFDLIW